MVPRDQSRGQTGRSEPAFMRFSLWVHSGPGARGPRPHKGPFPCGSDCRLLTRAQDEAVLTTYTEATIQQGNFLQGGHQHLSQNRDRH